MHWTVSGFDAIIALLCYTLCVCFEVFLVR